MSVGSEPPVTRDISVKLSLPTHTPATKPGVKPMNHASRYELPVPVLPGTRWRTIASGLGHICGIRDDGTLWCWGANDFGQLGTGDFDEFSEDLANFLTFKELPPPKDSVSELLIQSPDGKVETGDVWALINFGEEPVLRTWPQLQLRLGPSEGCRMTAGLPPNVVPPPKDELNVLLAIRLGPA